MLSVHSKTVNIQIAHACALIFVQYQMCVALLCGHPEFEL